MTRRKRSSLVFFVSIAALVLASWYFDWKSVSIYSARDTTMVMKAKHSDSELVNATDNKQRSHNFEYDREKWSQHSPRIAVLAGPHKAASTSIQEFFVELTGLKVSVESATQIPPNKFYSTIEWVWPLGVRTETKNLMRVGKDRKSFAALASFISGRRETQWLNKVSNGQSEEKRKKSRAEVADYFRSLFRRPWEEGKKILIAAEAFDSVVMDLQQKNTRASDRDEETHISPESSAMIDNLLDLFPFENSNATKELPPLRLDDIEVQINYRIPRIDHAVSIWHQLGKKRDLKNFFMSPQRNSFYQLNSLAQALQFVKKGIKTSIIDMKGVSENEALGLNNVATSNDTIIGGLRGVVACDILKMGTDDNHPGPFCDGSILHLPNYTVPVKDQNQKKDKSVRNLTDKQMEAINRVFEEYDCGVWQHLKKYQEQGLLRILYPSKQLFKTCNPEGSSRDISFRETVERVAWIASRDEDQNTTNSSDTH